MKDTGPLSTLSSMSIFACASSTPQVRSTTFKGAFRAVQSVDLHQTLLEAHIDENPPQKTGRNRERNGQKSVQASLGVEMPVEISASHQDLPPQ